MCQLNTIFITFFLLPYILCHVDQVEEISLVSVNYILLLLQNFIKQQNDVMKNFFFICVTLTIIGFVIGPILLIIILPLIVDPVIINDDDESIDSSNKSHTKERKSKSDSDETSSLTDDEEENIHEQDMEEIASF